MRNMLRSLPWATKHPMMQWDNEWWPDTSSTPPRKPRGWCSSTCSRARTFAKLSIRFSDERRTCPFRTSQFVLWHLRSKAMGAGSWVKVSFMLEYSRRHRSAQKHIRSQPDATIACKYAVYGPIGLSKSKLTYTISRMQIELI